MFDIADNERTLADLRSQLEGPGVVPFVGAGFCVPCGLPEWSRFLQELAGRQPTGSRQAVHEVRQLLATGQFEEAATLIEQRLGRKDYAACVQRRLSESAIARLAGPVLHVPALTRGPVITSNLDPVLERVFEQKDLAFKRVGVGPAVEVVRDALHANERCLIKIHGDAEDPDAWVITLAEYERAYGSKHASEVRPDRPLPGVLEQIFTSRTLLFLGCSLHLDRTLIYLERVARNHGAPPIHYAVLSDPEEDAARKARTAFLAERNIRPIWYPKGRHDLLEPLLDTLASPRFKPSFSGAVRKVSRFLPVSRLAIDFGTSFSAVQYATDGERFQPFHLRPDRMHPLVPTVVRFLSEHTYTLEGERVDEGLKAEFQNFKRYLGTDRVYEVGSRRFSAADLTTFFLRGLRQTIQMQFEGPLPPLFLGAPASFTTRQADELASAAERAGFEVADLVGEACAAGLTLRELDPQRDFAYMVVDIGAGTTDLSFIERTREFAEELDGEGSGRPGDDWIDEGEFVFETVCVEGDNLLGGLDFDEAICLAAQEVLEQEAGCAGVELFNERRAEIEAQATVAKIELNTNATATLFLPGAQLQYGSSAPARIRVTQEQFLRKSAPLLARLEALIDRALESYRRAGYDPSRLRAVMLAGQAGQLACVLELLNRKLKLPIVRGHEELAVVRGLAEQARLDGSHRRYLIKDVLYHRLYLACREGMRAFVTDGINRKPRPIAPIPDATGKLFFPLVEPFLALGVVSNFRLDLPELTLDVELEIFESGTDLRQPFALRKSLYLSFNEPAGELDLTLRLDENWNVRLGIRTLHTYITSVGANEKDREPHASRHASVVV